jgi:phage tail-like protein
VPEELKVHDASFLGSQFTLEIDGVELARFQGVGGLSWETEVVEEKISTKDGKVRFLKRPGQTKYPDVTFKRGLSADGALLKWYKSVLDGKVERKSGSIVVYDLAGEEIDRWNFENAWPSKWSASDLDSGSDAVVIEEVTLAVEHMERKK